MRRMNNKAVTFIILYWQSLLGVTETMQESGRISSSLAQRFSTAGLRPGTRPRHQLYRAARDSPGIYN